MKFFCNSPDILACQRQFAVGLQKALVASVSQSVLTTPHPIYTLLFFYKINSVIRLINHLFIVL